VAELTVAEAVRQALVGPVLRWADVRGVKARPEVPGPGSLPPDVHLAVDLVERSSGARLALRAEWSAALGLLAKHDPSSFAELLCGNVSAAAGDALIQMAVFGYMRYPK
jgi:hypothetical protein